MNVALYGSKRRWVMSEYGARHVHRDTDAFSVGSNAIQWHDDHLSIRVDDRSAPFLRKTTGVIRLYPGALNRRAFALDESEKHRWWPIAPHSRVEVEFDQPGFRWQGNAYLDSNWGDEPLESAFQGWHWSRARAADSTRVDYVVTTRRWNEYQLSLDFGADPGARDVESLPLRRIANSAWWMRREAVCDPGAPDPRVRTFEDTPFYTREHVQTTLGGQSVSSIHESLDLRRFESPMVQYMLPYKTRRIDG